MNNPILKAMRMHMWVKNLLVFVVLLLSHAYFDLELIKIAALGFLSFCLISSSAYMLNDLLDIESDKAHKTKRYRPITTGEISRTTAISFSAGLLFGSIAIASLIGRNFVLTVLLYYVVTNLYSFHFKKIALLDTIILSCLFTLRVIAGGVATELLVSPWLLAFSLFFFYSFSLLKRSKELREKLPASQSLLGRGYIAEDYQLINISGIATGYFGCFIIALYLNSTEVHEIYLRAEYLWFILPLFMYWVGRLWLLGIRGKIRKDPVLFVVQDKESWIIGVLSVLLIFLARG